MVNEALKKGRILSLDRKMRDDLSVIANQARVGDITDASLNESLSQFRKEINAFREKTHQL